MAPMPPAGREVACGAEEGEGGVADAVPRPSFSMIEPNSPMVNPFCERKNIRALVDERPKCFTGSRRVVNTAQSAGNKLG